MATLLVKVNQNGLEPFKVSETAAHIVKSLKTADREGGLFLVHRDGSDLLINPDFVAYVLPDHEETPIQNAEDPIDLSPTPIDAATTSQPTQ